jgi:hypothetical protein
LWWVFFEVRSCELFPSDWLRTAILLISTSWVARITGMSHWYLTPTLSYCNTIVHLSPEKWCPCFLSMNMGESCDAPIWRKYGSKRHAASLALSQGETV